MATEREKICFYISADEALALRRVALEQRRTLTALLEFAARQIVAEHLKSNGPDAPLTEADARAATKGV